MGWEYGWPYLDPARKYRLASKPMLENVVCTPKKPRFQSETLASSRHRVVRTGSMDQSPTMILEIRKMNHEQSRLQTLGVHPEESAGALDRAAGE